MPTENCECRKPQIGNLIAAKKDFDIELNKSYFVGDKDEDVLCGINAGCKTIRIKSIYRHEIEADITTIDLLEFYELIKNHET